MKRRLLLLLATVILAACAGEPRDGGPAMTPSPTAEAGATDATSPTPTPTPTSTMAPTPLATPTPTPTPRIVQSVATDTPTPTPLPSGGSLEIHIVDPIDLDPECLCSVPFTLAPEGARLLAEGGGPINCEFVNGQPLGTHHHVYELTTTLLGELMTEVEDSPTGALHAQLFLEGALVQYYTDVPPELPAICTEGSPCRLPPNTEPYLLVFPWVEGATLYLTKSGIVKDLAGEVPAWTLVLHIDR